MCSRWRQTGVGRGHLALDVHYGSRLARIKALGSDDSLEKDLGAHADWRQRFLDERSSRPAMKIKGLHCK